MVPFAVIHGADEDVFVLFHKNLFCHIVEVSWGPTHRNPQGKDLGGLKGYLEGIWGNPSLVNIQRKSEDKIRKTTENKWGTSPTNEQLD